MMKSLTGGWMCGIFFAFDDQWASFTLIDEDLDPWMTGLTMNLQCWIFFSEAFIISFL